MKKKLLRFTALLMCAVLVPGLAGCAGPAEPAPSLTYSELMATVRHSTDSALSDYIDYVLTWGVAGDRLWAVGQQRDPQDPTKGSYVFATMDTQGGDIAAQPFQLPEKLYAPQQEGQHAGRDVVSVALAGDGAIYMLLSDSLYRQVPVEENPDAVYHHTVAAALTLCSMGADGTLVRQGQLQLPASQTEGSCLDFGVPLEFLAAADGTFWTMLHRMEYRDDGTSASLGEILCRFAADGSILYWYELPEQNHGFAVLDEQTLLLNTGPERLTYQYGTEEEGNGITAQGLKTWLITDLTAEEPTMTRQETPCHMTHSSRAPGIGAQGDALYFRDYLKGVYRYDLTTGQEENLFLWSDYGFSADKVRQVFATGPDAFLVITKDGQDGAYAFHNLRLGEVDPLLGAETITIGVMGGATAEDLREAVTAYNFTEPEVYVQVVGYADEEQLEKDIINRTAPDIMLLTSNMNGPNYIRKGLFLDLYPMLDADPEISRDDLLPGMLAACEFDGTLPTVVLNFTVVTLTGDPDVVGSEPGWTWQEFEAVTAAHPAAVPIHRQGRDLILNYLIQLGGDRYIDYTSNTARLDSPEFIRLLEASAAYPPGVIGPITDTKADMAAGKALLELELLRGFRGIWASEYTFDGPVVFKGFPNDTGSGSAIQADLRFGINAACEKPEAAWAFLRTLLMPQFQKTLRIGLPSNRQALEAKAAQAMDPTAPVGGAIPMYLDYNNLTREQSEYFNQPATQAQVDQLMALIESADVLYERDAATFDIIREEAEYFYNGVRTAAEAAAIMQNRVQTYLDEQS